MVAAYAIAAAPAAAHSRHPECRTARCRRNADRLWARHHPPPVRLTPAGASWYGPADSGGSLACGGGDLTSSTLGVANKTLPCGTRVRICIDSGGHRCITVPVVDRGPYIAGRDYDLTEAAARAVGFLSIGVGTVYVHVGA